ncbi:MAG: ADP-ribosyltransferase [Putridiphycobacter sp.]
MMNCRITNAKILNTLNRLTLTERERGVKAMYVKDAIVTEKHFMSSAYDVNDFIQSSRQRNFEYIIKIEGKNGKLIEPASTLPKEAEVLFKSDTQFKVEKASYDLHPDNSYLNSQGQPFI